MAVDLHTHSTASDGTVDPAGIVAEAARVGLSAIAVTDHDTLSGIPEARIAADRTGIELVPGVELSVGWPTGKMHMLVYFLEPGTGPLQDELRWLRNGRDERNARIIDTLADLGYEVSMEEVLAQAGGESVGRPHIADALVARGWFTDRAEVFDQLLGDGRPAYHPRRRLEAIQAIHLARESGALTSIAHPYTIGLSREDYGTTFRELADEGLTGIETHHSEHPPELRRHLLALAEDLGLLPTGGSDYHGAGKPGIEIGCGRGDLEVPDRFLEDLRRRR